MLLLVAVVPKTVLRGDELDPVHPGGLLARVVLGDPANRNQPGGLTGQQEPLELADARLVFPLTITAMNSEHVWRTTDASFDWSRSTQKGEHSDGCIQARKPRHAS